MNKSKLFPICVENLDMLSNEEYIESFVMYDFETSLERKARYLKGETPKVKTVSIDKMKEFSLDDEVTISGLFRCETAIYLSEHPNDLKLWGKAKPNVEEIATQAFAVFDTMKNSETCTMGITEYHIIVSECVRRFFEVL